MMATSTKADIIFYGGDIITMDDNDPRGDASSDAPKVEAVAIAGGVILEVGSLKNVFHHACKDTQVIFLNEQTLMPGFIECHQHACLCALKKCTFTDISAIQYRTYAEISEAMETKMGELQPGDWGLFFGWDSELVPDLPTLSATYLDSNYSDQIPIVVIGQSGHVAWTNSPGLTIGGIDENTPDPSGGVIVRDENGNPTGQLFEGPAMSLVLEQMPQPDSAEVKKAFIEQWRYYASVGLTTVTDLGYMPNEGTDAILRRMADRPDCPIRVGLYKLEHATKHGDTPSSDAPKNGCCPAIFAKVPSPDKKQQRTSSGGNDGIGNYNGRLWEAGIKLVGDGSPHCGTAAIREPYMYTPLTDTLGFPKAPGYGNLNMESDALVDTVKFFHQKGTQIAIHTHGERASEQAIRAYEQVIGECGQKDNRHRLEHCGLTTVEQIARAGKLNLGISFFVDHIRYYALVYNTDIFGDRVNRWTPLSEATKSGVTWTIHQDHPTYPGDAFPFSNMKTAVTRCTRDDPTKPYGPEYRVSIHEALKAYTVNAAWQLHKENEIGTISVGKKADLVVLSKNPYDVDPFDLESIEVIESYLEGRGNGFAHVTTVPRANIKVLEKI